MGTPTKSQVVDMNPEYDLNDYKFPKVKKKDWNKVNLIIIVGIPTNRPSADRSNRSDYALFPKAKTKCSIGFSP